MQEKIIDALVGEFISRGINVSVEAIQTKLGLQDNSLETQIYIVLVDTLHQVTDNEYRTDPKKIYKAATVLLKLFIDNKNDISENIKLGLKEICEDVNDGMCKKFLDSLYDRICDDENSELYRKIFLKTQIDMHSKILKPETTINDKKDKENNIVDVSDKDVKEHSLKYKKNQMIEVLKRGFLIVIIVGIGICSLFSNKNENDKIDIDAENKSEEILMSQSSYIDAIRNTSGGEIICSHYNDFDSDGRCEMFAIVGETIDDIETGCIGKGKIWFVNQYGAYCVEETERFYREMEFYVFGNNIFVVLNEYYTSSGIIFLWSVVDGKPFEAGLSSKGNILTINNYNEVILTDSAYDGMLMKEKEEEHWLGHTYNDYYYYWNGSAFREYAAIQITQKELLQVDGASELIDYINDFGADINQIYYRNNNIFQINYQKEERYDDYVSINYYNVTFRYEGEKIQLENCQFNDGIIKKVYNTSLAEYPNGFDVNKFKVN